MKRHYRTSSIGAALVHEQGWTTTRLLTEGIILREPKGTLIYIQ